MLNKMERFSYVGSPLFFGVVLLVCGILTALFNPERLHGLLLICTGLICVSFYAVCALLARILEQK